MIFIYQKKGCNFQKINIPCSSLGSSWHHDWEALNQKIKQILNKEFPVYLPIFDKVSDTRKRTYKKVLKADVIYLKDGVLGSQLIKTTFRKISIILKSLKIKILFGENHIMKYLNEIPKIILTI